MKRADKKSARGKAAQKKVKMSMDSFFAEELPPLADVINFANNLPMSIYADSTVVKTPESVFRGSVLSKSQLVSQDYLLNFNQGSASFGLMIGTNNYRLPMVISAVAERDLEEDESDLIPLPPYKNVRAPLGSVIRSRRSVRSYSGKSISLEELSTLLFHANGVTGRLHVNAPQTTSLKRDYIELRAAPSGGGLYPLDMCLLATNVEGLEPRVYRYVPKEHALKPEGADQLPASLESLGQFGDIEVRKASVLLGYVYNFFENSRKYGEAGLGFAFMEAGYISGQVHLTGTALGLGICDLGGFSKSDFEDLFAADGISRHMIHLNVIGKR